MGDLLPDIHVINILKYTYFLWPQPVAKGIFLCVNSNISSVVPRVLILAREPELLYFQYACVDTSFYPSSKNISRA